MKWLISFCFLFYCVNGETSKCNTENITAIAYNISKSAEHLYDEPHAVKIEHLKGEYNLIILLDTTIKTVCRDIVKQFKNVEYLHLYALNLEHIEPEAFSNSSFKQIEIKDAELKTLHKNSFYKMSHIEEISLAKNNIETIADATFHKLHKIERITLSHNKLTHIKPAWFVHCPNLYEIDLCFNHIKVIQSYAFSFLVAKKPHVIQLSYNKITQIEPEAFPSEEIGMLKLNGNHLIYVNRNIFPNIKKGGKLILTNNRIECNEEVEGTFNAHFTEVSYDDNPFALVCIEVDGKLIPMG